MRKLSGESNRRVDAIAAPRFFVVHAGDHGDRPYQTFLRKAAFDSVVARQYRLREEHDVKRVRSRGRAVAQGPLVVRYLKNSLDPAQNRYTVIAGKRCGKAVQRNRLKRLVREALRGYHPYLESGYDVVVICRGTVEEMPTLTVAQASLASIFRRANLLADDARLPEPGAPISTGWTDDRPTPDHGTSSDPTPETPA